MAQRLSPHVTVMANAAQKAAKRLLRDFAEVEQLQVSGSFKGRGAFHKLLATEVPAAGVIAARAVVINRVRREGSA